MKDKSNIEPCPHVFRYIFHKLLFDPVGILCVGKAQSVAYTDHVCIYGNCLFAKGATKYYVGRFSSNTGKSSQFFHSGGDLSAELVPDVMAAADYRFSLILVKSG